MLQVSCKSGVPDDEDGAGGAWEADLHVTVRGAGNAVVLGLDGCRGSTRIGEVLLRARCAMSLTVAHLRLRCGARIVSESETLKEVASLHGLVDLTFCAEGEIGGMPVSCFGFCGHEARELQARLEADRRRHAEVEARWKEDRRVLAEAETALKVEIAQLRAYGERAVLEMKEAEVSECVFVCIRV
jgi:hypothetical protein